eukprot:Sspe_Gene.47294::Locus_24001_Transcript_1_1_Confidence_1.000_Length_1001::g.47294::m.47294
MGCIPSSETVETPASDRSKVYRTKSGKTYHTRRIVCAADQGSPTEGRNTGFMEESLTFTSTQHSPTGLKTRYTKMMAKGESSQDVLRCCLTAGCDISMTTADRVVQRHVRSFGESLLSFDQVEGYIYDLTHPDLVSRLRYYASIFDQWNTGYITKDILTDALHAMHRDKTRKEGPVFTPSRAGKRMSHESGCDVLEKEPSQTLKYEDVQKRINEMAHAIMTTSGKKGMLKPQEIYSPSLEKDLLALLG